MTKKDYIILAKAISEATTTGNNIVRALADALGRDNPKFDRHRFIVACEPVAPAAPVEPKVDFTIENHGSLFCIRPRNPEAVKWLRDTCPEDAQFLGNGMAVEPRYLDGVLNAIDEAGLVYATNRGA